MARFFDQLATDVRFGLRTYRRSPVVTFAALLAITLGIGATTAVFSVVDRVLFRALPYGGGDRIVSLGMLVHIVDGGEFLFAADYNDLRESRTPFEATASWRGVDDCDISYGRPIRERCAEVDQDFLPVLGIRPLLGVGFNKADVQPGAPRSALLSYGLWRSRFGGDPQVVGRTLQLDGAPARIVGILPAQFELPTLEHADVLVPQVIQPAGWQHSATVVLRVIGRLRKGVTLAAARAQLSANFARILDGVPPPFRKEVKFRVRSIRDRQMEDATTISWMLLGAVATVLLITCANVANLLLAKASRRRAETAIRSALGAARTRLVQQMAVESLLLALVGGALGCGMAAALLRVVVAVAPHSVPHIADASIDVRVLLFALAISVLSGLLFGTTAAFERPRLEALGSARVVSPRSSNFLKNALVAGQIALSTVLVTSAGLLIRSLWNVENQSLGMRPDHVVTAQLVLPVNRYTHPAERIAFFNQVEEQIAGMWGLTALGLSDSLPPGGWERSRPLISITPPGSQSSETGTGGLVTWRYVSPGFFDALHISLLAGRSFSDSERLHNASVCIVSQSLARRLFPSGGALGQHLKNGAEIVGIASDVRNSGLTSAEAPEYYMLRGRAPDDTYLNSTGPVAQRTLSLVIRSALDQSTVIENVRRRIGKLDPTLPMEFQTMYERLSELAERPRFNALLLAAFACTGLLLAGIGLYGTVAHLTAERTREIGVRMSLGATPGAIAAMMTNYVLKWTLIGAVSGALGAFASSRLLASLLFRVPAGDLVTTISAVLFLIVVALAAAAGPVVAAARVDPIEALRSDV